MHKINLNPLFDELRPVASVFDELLQGGLSTILGEGLATTSPRVNIVKNEKDYIIELAAPGLNKSDFNLDVEQSELNVSVAIKDESGDSENFIRREYRNASFSKSFHIPKDVDTAAISATYENGVLRIALPKINTDENTWSRTIDIN